MTFQTVLRQASALTKANLKVRYRSTFTGFIWVILFPILIYGAQSFAFHFILKINVQNYPVFLLTGLLPWIFFSSSVDMSTGAYLQNGRLLKSFPLHPLSILFAQIADNFINYVVALVVMLIPIAYYSQWPLTDMAFLIFPFISLFLFVVGFTNFVATLNVFFRDTKFILAFAMQVLFYISPIFYPRELIPLEWQWMLKLNPIAMLLAPFQILSTSYQMQDFWHLLQISYSISISMMIFSMLFWRWKRNELYFNI